MFTTNFVWGVALGLVLATVIWGLVLNNNKKKLAEFLQAPNKFFNGVMDELVHFSDDAKAEIMAALNKVNQNIGTK